MTHFISCLVFGIGGAAIAGILVDHKWKQAAKKLIERITLLEQGLAAKQSEINNLSAKVISLNSKVGLMDSTLTHKDKELNQLIKKVESPKIEPGTVATATKKRGPYKKKRYGRPASNNNSTKKSE